jgi:hypothetical protein
MISLEYMRFLANRTIVLVPQAITDIALIEVAHAETNEIVAVEIGIFSVFFIGSPYLQPSIVKFKDGTLQQVQNYHCPSEAFKLQGTLPEAEICDGMVREILTIATNHQVANLNWPVVSELRQ